MVSSSLQSRLSSQSGLKEAIFQNFRGMNRASDRLNSSPEFYYDQLNGYLKKDARSELGVIIQRDGRTKLNSVALGSGYGSTKSIRTIFEAKWNDGQTDIIIRAGTAWGKFDGVNTFDTLDTGRTDDVIGQCAMFKNELIMVDGGIPRKSTAAYSVSALSADSNMPQDSTAVWVHRDKVWLNSVANPMKAYFSKTNNANGATAFTGTTDAGTIDLSTVLPEGDTLVGFRTYGGRDTGLIALICKKYTVIYAAGANVYDFTFIQLFPTTCISISACDYIGKNIVYPSRSGFTSLESSAATDSIDVNTLSELIAPYYREMVGLVSDTTKISGVFDKTLNLFYLSFPIANNYQILVYSVDIKNFVGRYTYPTNTYSFCMRLNGDVLQGSDSYVYKMNNGDDDDGTAISWKLSFEALYFGTPSRYKKPIEFESLLQNSGNLTIYLDYWFGIDSLNSALITKSISLSSSASPWDTSLWDVSYWDSDGNVIYRTSDLLGRGRLMFLELRHSTSGAKIKIPWFIIRYILEGVN